MKPSLNHDPNLDPGRGSAHTQWHAIRDTQSLFIIITLIGESTRGHLKRESNSTVSHFITTAHRLVIPVLSLPMEPAHEIQRLLTTLPCRQ